MKHLILCLSLCLPSVAGADPMSAEEFENYATGKTLTYNAGGMAYGIEQYLANRRVRWSFIGEECVEGKWYEAGGMICFVYENNPEPQCWTFEQGLSGLNARFENEPDGREVYETRQSDEPLLCLGPKVGV